MYYVNGGGEFKFWCALFFFSLTWHFPVASNWRRAFKYHFSLLICRCRNSRCPQRHHHLLFVMCNIIPFFPSRWTIQRGRCVRSIGTCLCSYVNTNTFLCAGWMLSTFGDALLHIPTNTCALVMPTRKCKADASPLHTVLCITFFKLLSWMCGVKYITECHFVSCSVYHATDQLKAHQ